MHALEKEMATHSSILAWRIPGTEEPGGLPSTGSHRVGHDWCALAVAAEPVDPRTGLPQAQLPGRECNPTHQHIVGLKLYWVRPCPPEQDLAFTTLSLPSRSLEKSLSLIHQRANRRSKENYNPTAARKKTTLQKVNKVEKAELYPRWKDNNIKPQKNNQMK